MLLHVMESHPGDFDGLITSALLTWADKHPYPDDPVLSIADGKTFTPRELAREVQHRTEFGKKQLEVLRRFAEAEKDVGPEGLVKMFTSVARGR